MNSKTILTILVFIVGLSIYFLGTFYQGFDFGVLINSLIYITGIVAGFYILVFGGDKLVSGGSSIAVKYKIPPIVIGLTILSLGSSAPEFFINVLAAIKDETELLISNIIGSNISNLLLILGVTAIIYPLGIKNSTLYKEIPFSLLAVVALYIMVNDVFLGVGNSNLLDRGEGLVLLLFFGIFMYYVFTLVKNGKDESLDGIEEHSKLKSLGFLGIGIFGLYLGGDLVVNNAIKFSETLGISKTLVGVTIVAFGTSLPELAASVMAAMKKQADMVIGNVIGSNIFNIFWIGGVSGAISTIDFQKSLNTDLLILIIATLVVVMSVYTGKGRKISKTEGIIFLMVYAGYILYVIQRG